MYPFPTVQNAGGIPPSISLSPTSASASRTGNGAMTTNSVTATVTGGVSPYTYAWTANIGTVNSPTSATASFSYTSGGRGTYTGTGTLVVTDAIGQTVSATVPLTFTQNAVGATVAVSPSSSTQNRTGAGVSPNFTFTASISAWNDASYVNSWGYQVIENGVGTIINGSSSTATFAVSLNAGQTRSGYVQFYAYTDIGISYSPSAAWSTTAT